MQQFKASGLSTAKYLNFCVCYMTNMVDALDEKENRYQQKYKKPVTIPKLGTDLSNQ